MASSAVLLPGEYCLFLSLSLPADVLLPSLLLMSERGREKNVPSSALCSPADAAFLAGKALPLNLAGRAPALALVWRQ